MHVPGCTTSVCLGGSLYDQKLLSRSDTWNDGQAGLIYSEFPSFDPRRGSL